MATIFNAIKYASEIIEKSRRVKNDTNHIDWQDKDSIHWQQKILYRIKQAMQSANFNYYIKNFYWNMDNQTLTIYARKNSNDTVVELQKTGKGLNQRGYIIYAYNKHTQEKIELCGRFKQMLLAFLQTHFENSYETSDKIIYSIGTKYKRKA